MAKNYIQLIGSPNSIYMKITTGNHTICVGADKNGKIEIFPPDRIPEEFKQDGNNMIAGKRIQLNEAQTYRLLSSVENHITQGKNGAEITIGRLAERADVRTIHELMNAAGITFKDGQVDKYRDGGGVAIIDSLIGKDKIAYDKDPIRKLFQQYEYYMIALPASQQPAYSNLTQQHIENKVGQIVDTAKKHEACDKQWNWLPGRESTKGNCEIPSYQFANETLVSSQREANQGNTHSAPVAKH